MELNEYNKLREKISKKDFEGKNKLLDKWLYGATFFANAISIFFAFFLLYPALQSSFLMNVGNVEISNILAGGFSVGFLVVFEVVKRYLIRNFSFDYIWRNFKGVVTKMWLWLLLVITIIGVSFYLSLSGAQNFASTFDERVEIELVNVQQQVDSIRTDYQNRYITNIETDINELNQIVNEYRRKIAETPINFRTTRNDYQQIVESTQLVINERRDELLIYRNQMSEEINQIRGQFEESKEKTARDDYSVILLFIIIVALNESLIVLGLYFREYFEYSLYIINSKTYETYYLKRKYYEKMVKFLYGGGGLGSGDIVRGIEDLENELLKKTKIENVPKFVSEFLRFLRRSGIIIERRGEKIKFGKSYEDAINIAKSLEDNIIELEYEK
jgi:hypothetical protein